MTVSEQIIQVINVLCEKFGIAIDWTGNNVIPYIEILCKKLVTYEIATSIVWVVCMALSSIGSIIAFKKFAPTFKKGLEKDNENYDIGWHVGTTFAIIGFAILNFASAITIITQIMDIIKCLTFPEMYVFEYVSRFVQG
jgi:tryptophan-rich sensory protein